MNAPCVLDHRLYPRVITNRCKGAGCAGADLVEEAVLVVLLELQFRQLGGDLADVTVHTVSIQLPPQGVCQHNTNGLNMHTHRGKILKSNHEQLSGQSHHVQQNTVIISTPLGFTTHGREMNIIRYSLS